MNNKPLDKYIIEHQLSSCMNNTKWRELVEEITKDQDYNPSVNIKTVFEKENNNSFSTVWWEEVESEGYNLIEFLEINPIKEEFVGRLVKPKTTDYTKFIESGLKKHSIPYEVNEGIFKIYGYKR